MSAEEMRSPILRSHVLSPGFFMTRKIHHGHGLRVFSSAPPQVDMHRVFSGYSVLSGVENGGFSRPRFLVGEAGHPLKNGV